MKKLALALVCLVSVAFFASCTDPITNPEPAISILEGTGYIANNDIIDLDVVYPFGFVMSSNAQTQAELASLVITIDDEPFDTVTLTGTEYTYRGEIYYTANKENIVGNGNIKAVVTDAKGEVATATISFSINDPALPLTVAPFEWFRLGSVQVNLDDVGLVWTGNAKETHAQIKPQTGVKLYIFNDPSVWEATTTDVEKARLMSTAQETMVIQSVYNNVSTTAGGTYNDVIATITEDGVFHLIHVTKCEIGAFQPMGYPITITGETK